jgi:hypothetical protein
MSGNFGSAGKMAIFRRAPTSIEWCAQQRVAARKCNIGSSKQLTFGCNQAAAGNLERPAVQLARRPVQRQARWRVSAVRTESPIEINCRCRRGA